MKTVSEFEKELVKIEYIEQSECFGHYPFQLVCENKKGGIELNALALGGDVAACYRRFAEYKCQGAKRIYMSLDFPKGGDIENDYVAIFSFEDDKLSVYAILYEVERGERIYTITESKQLDRIKEQLASFL